MWNTPLPDKLLKQAIRQCIQEGPVSFVRLGRVLPEIKGPEDLVVNDDLVLWRGLSEAAVAALKSLHAEGSIFFWLCLPSIYSKTDDAPFMQLMSCSHRPGERAWLPTLMFKRPPTKAEARQAVSDYVDELTRSTG